MPNWIKSIGRLNGLHSNHATREKLVKVRKTFSNDQKNLPGRSRVIL